MASKTTADKRSAEKPAKETNHEFGARGERAAAAFLEERLGYDIVERNWRCRAGEADIVARDGETIVLVEVKTRRNDDKGHPEEAVTQAKRKRYEKIAKAYMAKLDDPDAAVRLDVISLSVIAEDRALLRHHRGAFCFD